METEHTTGSCPASSQPSVRTWISSSTQGTPRTPGESGARFHGDGVRYKAKLIGVDAVQDAEGHKMCLDSMMKLKGFEAAARKQGKHKQRVWMKLSSKGLKILDERTGAVLHDHERSRISSLTKDESDPRALAYIYQDQNTYSLFYIKMANLADPVLADMQEVCQSVDQEVTQTPAQGVTQTNSLILLNESSAPLSEGSSLEDVFSPHSVSAQSKQVSFRNELMEVFSVQVEEQLSPNHSSCATRPESPQTKLSTSQILSMFPVQPTGGPGSPYSSPPYSPTSMPWGLQGPLGNQFAGQATVAPWHAVPGSLAAWPPAAPPADSHIQAPCSHPGLLWGGNPSAVSGFPTALNFTYGPSAATGTLQSGSPVFDPNSNL